MKTRQQRLTTRQKRKEQRQLDRELQNQLVREHGRAGLGMMENAKEWLRVSSQRPIDPKTDGVYGQPIPRNYGTQRHACHIIWTTTLHPVPPASLGAEFEERYVASFAVKVCEREQGALLRVWFNNILVFDVSHNGDQYSSHPNFSGKIVFYPGSETQTADPTLEAEEGAGDVPPTRGTCYLVCKDIPLDLFGNQLPEVEVEVQSLATPDYTVYNTALFTPNSADVEVMCISRSSGLLYQYSDGLLSVVRRRVAAVTQEIDVQTALDAIAGSLTAQAMAIDDGEPGVPATVYLMCSTGAAAFILRYDGSFTSSYADRITGADFGSAFVYGDRLFVCDTGLNRVRCFDKDTLALLWTRTGPASGLTAGNFTYDNQGRVWLVWWDPGDADTLYLSRMTAGGTLYNFVITQALGAAVGIIYDTNSNVLISGGVDGNDICRISLGATPAVVDTLAGHTGALCGPLFTSQYRCANSSWWCDGTNFYRIKHSTLTARKTVAISNYAGTGSGTEAYGYDFAAKAIWICRDTGSALSKLPLERYTAGGVALDLVAGDLCTSAGLDATDIDVTALSALTVQGLAVAELTTAEDPLTTLLTAFQVGVREHYESGYTKIKLEFVPRSAGSSYATIPEDSLGIGDGAPETEVLGEEWTNEEDLPKRVSVRYADVSRDYDANIQKVEYPEDVTSAEREDNLDLTDLVLTDDFARQLADAIISSVWVEGARKFFTVPLQYLYLEPEDVMTVTRNGIDHTIRIESVELGANNILEVSAVLTHVAGYTSTTTGTTAPAASNPVLLPVSSQMVLVDCPCVRDIDGVPGDAGFYGFIGPLQPDSSWVGGRIVRRADGSLYPTLAVLSSASTIARTITALADTTNYYSYSATDTIQVQLSSGSFTTHTEAELYADKLTNLIAVGSESAGWELIQFATATDNGAGLWTLTGMLRGRFGTERFASTHAAGDTVVLFDFTTPSTARIKLPLRDRNISHRYKAVSLGAPQDVAPSREFTNTALGLTPYSVRLVSGTRNTPSANDWTINWTRRTRIGQELIDYDDTAVNEETEEYEVDIRDGVSSAVLRTITVGPGLPALSGINISATSGTQLITRASGSWLTDGFLVGQQVDLAGFSNADNNNRFVISALTATDMTLTSGATLLVTEASGAGKTVTAVTPAALYTAAMQTADGGSKSSFYATIYQISARLREHDDVGRGIGVQTLIS